MTRDTTREASYDRTDQTLHTVPTLAFPPLRLAGFDLVRALPTTDLPDLPNQSVLEEIVAATAHHPA